MLEDLRSAVRQLWRKPAIALVAASSLALGTGATAGIFSCLDAFYLRPLAVPHTSQVVRLFGATDQQAYGMVSYQEYLAIRAQTSALESLAVAQGRGATWLTGGEPQDLLIYLVSPDFFQTLGIRPAVGRFFGPGEDQTPLVVLGYATWQRRFGGDPNIVGRTIRLSRGTAADVMVAGVLPREFRDLGATGDRDIWMPPSTFEAVGRGSREELESWRNTYFHAIGRLAPGASLRQLQSELSAIGGRLAQTHPDTNSRRRFAAMTDFDWRLHVAGTTAWVLLAMVILVVAISCVNVANLLLARVEARRKEFATRAALGAPRSRLARQLAAESLVIGLLGAVAGLMLAQWLVAVLPALIGLPPQYRAYIMFRIDPRVLGSTIAVALLTALLCGIAPAAAGSRTDLALTLRNAPSLGLRRFSLRSWLAISQLALSLILLSATVMCGQSFWNARRGNNGFGRNNVLTVWGHWKPGALDRRALDRVASLAGVRDVSLAVRAPLSGSGSGIAMAVTLPGHPEFIANPHPATVKFTSVDFRYFRLLGIRLIKGRLLDAGDIETSARVAVISQAMARRYWPTDDPIGKDIRAMPKGVDYRIVGIAADAPINSIGEVPEPYIYTSWWQNPLGEEHTLFVEADRDAAALAPLLRAALEEVSPQFHRVSLATMDELISDSANDYRRTAQLIAALAALGLVLAAVGFYGVTAYSVTLRTREIGIRMAVGARDTDAAALVIRQAVFSAALGILIGLPCSLALTHAFRAMLFGVSEWYAPAFVAASAVLMMVAIVAAALPAVRAARVDPLAALRCE